MIQDLHSLYQAGAIKSHGQWCSSLLKFANSTGKCAATAPGVASVAVFCQWFTRVPDRFSSYIGDAHEIDASIGI